MVSHGQKAYFPPAQSSGGVGGGFQHSQNPHHQQQQRQNPGSPHHQQMGGFQGFKLGGISPAPSSQQQRRIPPGGSSAPRRWTVQQLRASDAIIPLQSGTNQFASQRGMTGFGTGRNTTTPVYGGLQMPTEEEPRPSDAVIPLQYGTNQYATQRGMTGFGVPRDVTGKHLHRLYDDEFEPIETAGVNGGGGSSWQ